MFLPRIPLEYMRVMRRQGSSGPSPPSELGEPPIRISVTNREFDLTKAQFRVVSLLAKGCATSEMARRLGVRENTIRAHLKAAFARTRTRNRGELIKLLITSRMKEYQDR